MGKSLNFVGLFGLRPLQFFRVRETPLLFVYFEICHYNSSSTRFLPFSTSYKRQGPLSDHICTHMFCILLSPLTDMWAPYVRFFLDLQFLPFHQAVPAALAAAIPTHPPPPGWCGALELDGAELVAWPVELATGPAQSSRPGWRSSQRGRRGALAAWPAQSSRPGRRRARVSFFLAQDRDSDVLLEGWRKSWHVGSTCQWVEEFFFSNTVIHVHIRSAVWGPMSIRRRKWQESGRRRIVMANFKIDE
jgi:hypothetical protein